MTGWRYNQRTGKRHLISRVPIRYCESSGWYLWSEWISCSQKLRHTYIPSTTVSTWCRRFVPSLSLWSYKTPYLTWQKVIKVKGIRGISLTLLKSPLPSGSDIATYISLFMDLRYCPTPATVPPVPSFVLRVSYRVTWKKLTCACNKCIYSTSCLPPYFGTSSVVVRLEVASVLQAMLQQNAIAAV